MPPTPQRNPFGRKGVAAKVAAAAPEKASRRKKVVLPANPFVIAGIFAFVVAVAGIFIMGPGQPVRPAGAPIITEVR
jgi:hypothetical protein